MAIVLRTPPLVRQQFRMSCWAAAYTSWRAVSGSPTMLNGGSSSNAQTAITNLIGMQSGSVNADGGATRDGLLTMGFAGAMNHERFRGRQVKPLLFESRMRDYGHLFMYYIPMSSTQPSGHVVVVYGIDERDRLLIMNPDPDVPFPSFVPVSVFQSKTWVDLAYSRISTRPLADPFASMRTGR